MTDFSAFLANRRSPGVSATATDGSQSPAGFLLDPIDASLADRHDGLIVARHAIVADTALGWPVGITGAEKTAALVTLTSLGILARPSV